MTDDTPSKDDLVKEQGLLHIKEHSEGNITLYT